MHNPLPELIFKTGDLSDGLFWRALWLTSVTFVLVLLIFIGVIVMYRSRPGHKAFYTHGDSPKALGITIFLSIAVFIGIDLHLAYYDHHAYTVMFDEVPPNPVPVQVLAKQFEWNFRYPGKDGVFGTKDDFCEVKKLVVPEGQAVMLHMQSIDVLHSLFLPNVRKKQDVVPGLETSLWFATDPGTNTTAARLKHGKYPALNDKPEMEFDYEIACAELCGLGHTDMNARLIVLTPDEYKAWVDQKTKELEDFDNPAIWKEWKTWTPPDPNKPETEEAEKIHGGEHN